jgi:hypothetical protein
MSSGGARGAAARDESFAGLSLAALRDYRGMLGAEETQVSYWRRLVQARLDVINAGAGESGPPVHMLRSILTDPVHASRRTALLAVLPRRSGFTEREVPPLPNLAGLWEREPGEDPRANAALVAELTSAERALSAYRNALHRQLAAVTDELIVRYREDPRQSLAALPAQRRPPEPARAPRHAPRPGGAARSVVTRS